MTSFLKLIPTLALASLAHGMDAFRFQSKTVAENFARPMGFDLAPNGSIFLIELQGKVNRIDPTTGSRTTIASPSPTPAKNTSPTSTGSTSNKAKTEHQDTRRWR